MTYFVSSGA